MSIQDLKINPKLRFFCQKVLPTIYDDSLSYYECICKIASAVNMLTDDVNELILYVQNLDKEIDAKVAEAVNKYVESAEFATMVNNIINRLFEPFKSQLVSEWESYKTNLEANIDTKLENKISKGYPLATDLDTLRVYREVNKDNTYYKDKQYFSNAQSICYDGTYIYAGFNSSGDYSNASLAKLKKFDIEFNLIAESEISAYHINDLTAINGNIYCCSLNPVDGTNYGLLIINATTLQITGNIVLQFNPVSVCNDGENLYILNQNVVNVYNLQSNAITETFQLEYDLTDKFQQAMEYYNEMLYLTRVYPSEINVFTLKGEIVVKYNIPYYLQNAFPSREVEGIASLGNGEFILTSLYNPTSNHYVQVSNFFKINVSKNIQNNIAMTYHTEELTYDILVNNSLNPLNPDGLNTPFKYLFEAVDILHSPLFNNRNANIKCSNYTSEFPLNMFGVSNVTISGPYQIEGLLAVHINNVSLTNITIEPTLNLKKAVEILYSNGLWLNCIINQGSAAEIGRLASCVASIGPNAVADNIKLEYSTVNISYGQNTFSFINNSSGNLISKNKNIYSGTAASSSIQLSDQIAYYRELLVEIKNGSYYTNIIIPVVKGAHGQTLSLIYKSKTNPCIIWFSVSASGTALTIATSATNMQQTESITVPSDVYVSNVYGIY